MSAPQHDTATATLSQHPQHHRHGWCRLCRVEVDSASHFESRGHRNTLLTSLPACLRRSDNWDIDRLNAACFIELPTLLKHQEETDEKEHLRRQRRSAEVERQKLLAKRLDVVRQRMNARWRLNLNLVTTLLWDEHKSAQFFPLLQKPSLSQGTACEHQVGSLLSAKSTVSNWGAFHSHAFVDFKNWSRKREGTAICQSQDRG